MVEEFKPSKQLRFMTIVVHIIFVQKSHTKQFLVVISIVLISTLIYLFFVYIIFIIYLDMS